MYECIHPARAVYTFIGRNLNFSFSHCFCPETRKNTVSNRRKRDLHARTRWRDKILYCCVRCVSLTTAAIRHKVSTSQRTPANNTFVVPDSVWSGMFGFLRDLVFVVPAHWWPAPPTVENHDYFGLYTHCVPILEKRE